MSATTKTATETHGLTVEVYLAGQRPMREFGVAIYQGRTELVREEEFWTEAKADRAVDRLVADAVAKLAQPERLAA